MLRQTPSDGKGQRAIDPILPACRSEGSVGLVPAALEDLHHSFSLKTLFACYCLVCVTPVSAQGLLVVLYSVITLVGLKGNPMEDEGCNPGRLHAR